MFLKPLLHYQGRYTTVVHPQPNNTVSRDLVRYKTEGRPLVPSSTNTTRPRFINQGHMNIDSNYNAYVEIVNLPGRPINLTGTPPVNGQQPAPTNALPGPGITTATPESKAVARFYYFSCKAKYFTQEKLDEHVKAYPEYCRACNACRKPNGRNYCCWSGGYRIFWCNGKGGAVI